MNGLKSHLNHFGLLSITCLVIHRDSTIVPCYLKNLRTKEKVAVDWTTPLIISRRIRGAKEVVVIAFTSSFHPDKNVRLLAGQQTVTPPVSHGAGVSD